MKQDVRVAVSRLPVSSCSASAEVKPWLLAGSDLWLRIEVPRVPTSVHVSPSAPRGSDRRGGAPSGEGGRARRLSLILSTQSPVLKWAKGDPIVPSL